MQSAENPENRPEAEKDALAERFLNLISDEPTVAILMSGRGTNAEAILKNRQRYPNLEIVAISTDNPDSYATHIANEFQLDLLAPDITIKDDSTRADFFGALSKDLESEQVDLLLYAGFMRVAPPEFVSRFPGMNVHPADLTIRDSRGMAKYVGIAALERMTREHDYVAATVHLIESGVDQGQPLAVSEKLAISDGDRADVTSLHERLRTTREHQLYPAVLEKLASKRVSLRDLPLYL
ncbi:hypothetical protein EXS54_00990 [Patescibacteria group bacterium]|nr:hypothetical protein [Patescibacteria group bacterium]